MKLKEITLRRNKKFLASNIQELNVKICEDFIIILGTNGSGKSSFLQELLPSVPKSSIFTNKGGKKILKLEHDNNSYTLTSQLTTKSQMDHSFLKGHEELNLNSTSGSQQELINQYLHLPTKLHNLLLNQLNISSMTYSNRKTYFTKINPYNLEYLFTLLKTINKRISDVKANIQFLQIRNEELKGKVLDVKTIQEYKKQLENLTQQKLIQSKLIEVSQEQLDNINSNYPTIDTDVQELTLVNLTKEAGKVSQLYNIIKELNFDTTIPSIQTNLNEFTNILVQLENWICLKEEEKHQLVQEINKLTENINVDVYDINKLQEELKSLQHDINNIKGLPSDYNNPLPNEAYTQYSSLVTDLKLLIETFLNKRDELKILKKELCSYVHKEVSTYSENEIRGIYTAYYNKWSQSSQERKQIEQFISQLSDKELNYCQIELPTCSNIKTCSLYQHFGKLIEETKQTITKKLEQLEHLKKDIIIYDKITNISKTLIEVQMKLQKTKEHIINLLLKYKIIPMILNTDNVEKQMLSSPYKLLTLLDNEYHLTMKYLKKQELLKINEEKQTLCKKLIDTSSTQKTIMEILTKKQILLKELKKQISNKEKQFNYYKQLEILTVLLQSKIQEYETKVKQHEKNLILLEIYSNKVYYETILSEYTPIYSDILNKVHRLENVLKEQEMINVRLKNDVQKPKKDLTETLQKLETIQQGLLYLNNKYNLGFIIRILKIVNSILKEIFSYNMEVFNELLSEEGEFKEEIALDTKFQEVFKFSVRLGEEGDTIVPDIKDCSSAQQEVINLGFVIAILKVLGLKEYPLFLDEIDKAMDNVHRQKLVEFLYKILNEGLVTQIFVSSNTYFHENLLGQVVVLNDENILLPDVYNTNVKIKK